MWSRLLVMWYFFFLITDFSMTATSIDTTCNIFIILGNSILKPDILNYNSTNQVLQVNSFTELGIEKILQILCLVKLRINGKQFHPLVFPDTKPFSSSTQM